MIYKKTFWLNVVVAISWALLCLLSFATDIDYVERSSIYHIVSALTQLLILATLLMTAFSLYKPNPSLMRKLALFGNYFSVTATVSYFLTIVLYQPSMLISIDFLIVFFLYCLFILPFVINLKVLKAS